MIVQVGNFENYLPPPPPQGLPLMSASDAVFGHGFVHIKLE
jgi:hypothetical protein